MSLRQRQEFEVSCEEEARIKALFVGNRIVHVDLDQRELTLSNNTRIRVVPNQGGCSCSAGDYELTQLATVDNIITDVVVVNDPSGDGITGEGYRIFVIADAQQINVVSVDGDDGNGYYGTGYYLHVLVPELYKIEETP